MDRIKWNILKENQAGYRRGYSTYDHIFSLHSAIKLYNKKGFGFFVDFSGAFDHVIREGLFLKLNQLGISWKFLEIVRNLYSSIKSKFWDGNIQSP